MRMENKWLEEEIKDLKKFIDGSAGEIELMYPAKLILNMLEMDDSVVINRPDGKNNDHLYIRRGQKINGKYHLRMTYIY